MDQVIKDEIKKRLDSMNESDFGMTTSDFVNYRVINFDNDNIYNVTITDKGRIKYSCDCPDYCLRCRYLGIPCKHIMYVQENANSYVGKLERIQREILSRFELHMNKQGD